ncbi:MAG TPA: porin family protein, partial [Brumimicrobium sp.]|nr:porin family protein [Brumimicrobium sp.]
MKKVLLFTALFSFGALFTNAQDARDQFKFGLKGGATLSNVYDSDGEKFDANAKLGYTAGLTIDIPLGEIIGIHPEVLITQKGYKGTGSLLGQSYDYSRTTTFLEIPLLIALKPTEFLTVVAGPQFAYLLKQNDKFNSFIFSDENEQEFEQDDIRKNLLGFVGGVDLNFNHFTIGARAGVDFQANRGKGDHVTPRYK